MSNDRNADPADFVEIAHRIVWCTLATVDGRGRPRSRLVHPVWTIEPGGELVGRVASRRGSPKSAHLAGTPFASCSYWDPGARRGGRGVPGRVGRGAGALVARLQRSRPRRSASTRPRCSPVASARPTPGCSCCTRGGCAGAGRPTSRRAGRTRCGPRASACPDPGPTQAGILPSPSTRRRERGSGAGSGASRGGGLSLVGRGRLRGVRSARDLERVHRAGCAGGLRVPDLRRWSLRGRTGYRRRYRCCWRSCWCAAWRSSRAGCCGTVVAAEPSSRWSLVPVGAVFWWGFALPAGPVLAVLRTGLIGYGRRALR